MTKAERINNPGKQRPPYWVAESYKGRVVATFFCPQGHRLKLREHDVATDGTVNPRVECNYVHPDTEVACEFNDKVKLEGWSHGESVAVS